MSGTLAVVERAHRGAVEQQYAHVLWLVHALHRQHRTDLLLRGPASVYALEAAGDRPPLRLGELVWEHPPDYRAAIGRLQSHGSEVLVSVASLTALALTDLPLIHGISTVTDDQIAKMYAEYDRIWYL